MAKKGNNVDELNALIVPAFDLELLIARGVPEGEINEFARYKLIPAELLVNAPWNYKEDNEATEEKLEQNLKLQGQVENLNVRKLETGFWEVGNGNHRNKIFQRNGRRFILACDHGEISQAEFQRRVILQNDTRWQNNELRLAELISEISQTIPMDDLLVGMPYTMDELQAFTEMLSFDLQQFKFDGGDGRHTKDKTDVAGAGDEGQQLILSVPYETQQLWFSAKARLQNEFSEIETDAQVLEYCLQAALMNIEQPTEAGEAGE
ncbi:hypothetical protein KC887_00525 [Candidatus Kaiserbacteria bacterium]|nr:hypothetical protein [Candidatus Kaiserbacteria bacterium]